MKISHKKVLVLVVILLLVFTQFAGCTSKGTEAPVDKKDTVEEATPAKQQPKEETEDDGIIPKDAPELTYTVYHSSSTVDPWIDNKGDVVTPYIEDMFKLKCEEVILRGDSSNKLNMLYAANALPDVYVVTQDRVPDLLSLDISKDLTDLIPKHMPFYWNDMVKDVDKLYHKSPSGEINIVFQYDETRKKSPELLADPYFHGGLHTLMTREDLLEKAGYKFTPMAEIIKTCNEELRAPTVEDMKLEPAIDTPEALYDYLKKLDELDIKVNGLDLIPTTFRWGIFHIGTMFDWGHWKWDSVKKEANGFLGSNEAYDYCLYLNRLYQDGLLDKDCLIQKSEQLKQKVSSGLVGVFFTDAGSPANVDAQLKAVDESYVVRPLLLPVTENSGVFDCYSPGWLSFALNKDLDDEKTERIMTMWNYLCTDDGLDVITWGPESEEFFELNESSKRVFVNSAWEDALVNKVEEQGGPHESGLYNYGQGRFESLIGNISPVPSRFLTYTNEPIKSLAPVIDVYSSMSLLSGAPHLGQDATSGYGSGEVVGDTSKYFWGEFRKNGPLASLLIAETQDEFDSTWNEILTNFKKAVDYETAQEEMKQWFNSMGVN